VKIKKLFITILIINILGCVNRNHSSPILNTNNVKLIFVTKDSVRIDSDLMICVNNINSGYFGVPIKIIENIPVKNITKIIVKIENQNRLIAKPIDILSSEFPDTNTFFSISNDKKYLSGRGRIGNNYWFIITNNINNPNDLNLLFNQLDSNKCNFKGYK